MILCSDSASTMIKIGGVKKGANTTFVFTAVSGGGYYCFSKNIVQITWDKVNESIWTILIILFHESSRTNVLALLRGVMQMLYRRQ